MDWSRQKKEKRTVKAGGGILASGDLSRSIPGDSVLRFV